MTQGCSTVFFQDTEKTNCFGHSDEYLLSICIIIGVISLVLLLLTAVLVPGSLWCSVDRLVLHNEDKKAKEEGRLGSVKPFLSWSSQSCLSLLVSWPRCPLPLFQLVCISIYLFPSRSSLLFHLFTRANWSIKTQMKCSFIQPSTFVPVFNVSFADSTVNSQKGVFKLRSLQFSLNLFFSLEFLYYRMDPVPQTLVQQNQHRATRLSLLQRMCHTNVMREHNLFPCFSPFHICVHNLSSSLSFDWLVNDL